MALFIGLAAQVTSVSGLFWLLRLGTAALMSVNISDVQVAIKGQALHSLMDVVANAANQLGAGAFGLLASVATTGWR